MTRFDVARPRPSPWPTVFAGAAFALAVYVLLDRTGWFTPAPRVAPRAVTARGELAPLEQNLVAVFKQAAPSVAHITTRALVRRGYRVGESSGTGSGFVWDDRGTLVTNYHVVKGAQRIVVSIGDQRFAAEFVDADQQYDIAVLRLRGSVGGLAPLAIGTSADLQVGQTAIAIGNPYGFDQTMTTGVISALNRTIETQDGNALGGLIQVDAAINPGNSGGPLLDSAGRLIGITTAIYSPSGASAGIGFAVPVDLVNDVVPRLLGNKAATPVLGIRNPYSNLRYVPFDDYANLDFTHGAVFTEVVPGLGAATAGLRPTQIAGDGSVAEWGDILVAIGGMRVRTFDEVAGALRGKKAGQTIEVTVVRGLPGEARIVKVPVELKAPPPG